MPVDLIRYDLLAQDALRGVVKKVLTDIAARGLPGEHHFFISFHTRADGVKISDRLREKYPDELTIVQGTPTLVWADGSRTDGYVDRVALEARLKQVTERAQ
jgi:hypothetical protein